MQTWSVQNATNHLLHKETWNSTWNVSTAVFKQQIFPGILTSPFKMKTTTQTSLTMLYLFTMDDFLLYVFDYLWKTSMRKNIIEIHILSGSYLCFFMFTQYLVRRGLIWSWEICMSKSVLTVDCFCHPLVMVHRWFEKSRSVMPGHLKNLAASSLAISENGSVWEWPQRLRNV